MGPEVGGGGGVEGGGRCGHRCESLRGRNIWMGFQKDGWAGT